MKWLWLIKREEKKRKEIEMKSVALRLDAWLRGVCGSSECRSYEGESSIDC